LVQLSGIAEWGIFTAWITQGGEMRIQCGCRDFTYDEAMRHWANREDRPKTRLALEWAKIALQ
jgi:hypothetical protein